VTGEQKYPYLRFVDNVRPLGSNAAGVITGSTRNTPLLEEDGTPIANTYVVAQRNGAGNLSASGTRVVDPLAGGTVGNPVGSISVTSADSAGSAGSIRPVFTLDALNNQSPNAQNLLDAQALSNSLRSGNPVGALGSGLGSSPFAMYLRAGYPLFDWSIGVKHLDSQAKKDGVWEMMA
jgi:hypothetical protein